MFVFFHSSYLAKFNDDKQHTKLCDSSVCNVISLHIFVICTFSALSLYAAGFALLVFPLNNIYGSHLPGGFDFEDYCPWLTALLGFY